MKRRGHDLGATLFPVPMRRLAFASAVLLAACQTTPLRPDAPPPGSRLDKCGRVLGLGDGDAWDAGMVESPTVWYDAATRRYGMLYVGYGRKPGTTGYGYTKVTAPHLGLAWSGDGRSWTKDPRNPVFRGDATGATGPFLLREGGLYHLYYISTTESGYEKGTKTIGHATSANLVDWTPDPLNPMVAPAGDGWRSEAAWRPMVVRDGNRYVMFFNASGVVDGHHEEFTGVATSTDLRRWTVDDARSPVLVGSRQPGAWDAMGRAGDPSVYRVGDRWYMAYYSWDRVHAQDGLAWTTAAAFPYGWRAYEHNPILRTGPPGSFDALHAHKPTVFRHNGRHFHFYTAVDTAQVRTIGLAMDGGCR